LDEYLDVSLDNIRSVYIIFEGARQIYAGNLVQFELLGLLLGLLQFSLQFRIFISDCLVRFHSVLVYFLRASQLESMGLDRLLQHIRPLRFRSIELGLTLPQVNSQDQLNT
jgi:hypothetical protein